MHTRAHRPPPSSELTPTAHQPAGLGTQGSNPSPDLDWYGSSAPPACQWPVGTPQLGGWVHNGHHRGRARVWLAFDRTRKPRRSGCPVTGQVQLRLQVTHQGCYSSDPRRSQLKGKYSIKLVRKEKDRRRSSLSSRGLPHQGRNARGRRLGGRLRPCVWHGQSKPKLALASPLLSAGVSAGLALGSLVGTAGGLWSCCQPREDPGGSQQWVRPVSVPGVFPWDIPSRLPALPAQAPPLFISGETSMEDTPDLVGPHFLQGWRSLCHN